MTSFSMRQRFPIAITTLLLLSLMSIQPALANSSSTGTGHVWTIQAADAPIGGGSFNLKLDSTGQPHIAFGGDHLYYATLNGGNWNIEVVDSAPGTGDYASLAFDSADRPHIVYFENKKQAGTYMPNIRYAYWNGSQWVIHIIFSLAYSNTGVAQGWLSMGLDSTDAPHIVFFDAVEGMRYASWTGTQWTVENIAGCGAPSMVLDSNDRPHITYNCSNAIRYNTRIENSWHTDIIDANDIGLDQPSIALDSYGYPHIAYYTNSPTAEVRYSSWNGTFWDTPVVVDTSSGWWVGVSLVIDNLDLPHISYAGFDLSLKAARFNGNAWELESVPNAAKVCEITSQTLDTSGNVHIAYKTCRPGGFIYVHETAPNTWTPPQLVVATSWVGFHSSITVDQNDHPHLSTLDFYGYSLRYSTWDGSQWINEVVDTVGDWHLYSSIQTDSNNRPHIAYFASSQLKYAYWDGDQWQKQSLGVAGRYASLALDQATNYPRIAFCSNGLKYASWNGLSWDFQTVDTVCGGWDFGGENSLVLDGNGNPHIAYADMNALNKLFYTYWDPVNSQWVKQEIQSNSPYGFYGRSLALDNNGVPHIAYCDSGPTTHYTAQYASWTGSSWDIVTIDDPHPDAEFICQMISLTIDSNDTPHISYPDVFNNSIRYVTWKGATWASQVIREDQTWTGLSYAPIAVGPANEPWIAYGETYTGDLMAARGMLIPSVNGVSQWTSAFDLAHGWTVSDYVRTVGDVNGDGKADLIGFGLDGVYVALSDGGTIGAISRWTTAFDLAHGWTVSQYARTVGDVNGDGKADLVGFGLDGVYIALSTGDGFGPISQWTTSFDLSHGWTVQDYARTVGDVNGDGKADLVGFGLDGVYVALSTGSGFGAIGQWTNAFDLSHGWTVSQFVRTLGDINGDGKADLVGFGLDGVYVALSTGSGFGPISQWTNAFDLSHGWTVSQFVRTVGDVNGDGKADLIGFGLDGVYIALSDGYGFSSVSKWITAFDLSHGWTVSEYARTVGDINGDGKADPVGFGLDGVYIATTQ